MAVLEAEELRVDVDGVPAVDGLAFVTAADRALVLGAPRALLDAASGARPAVRGRLLVLGAPADKAARAHVSATVARDPPLPPRWTALEYATWSARLAGASAREATKRAAAALERVQLGETANVRLDRVVPVARRATVLAAALAKGAQVVLLDDPLGGLAEEIAVPYARIVVDALEGLSWAVFAPHVPIASSLALAAGDAVVVSGSRVDAQGPPSSLARASRRFTGRVHGDPSSLERFAARLGERGARFEAQGGHAAIDLGASLSTAELLGLATESDVVVVELRPLARALG